MGIEADGMDVVGDLRLGSRESIDRLVPLVYKELRQIAHRHLSSRGDGATLNTTALVNEAYLKLVDQSRAHWNDRVHFLPSRPSRCAISSPIAQRRAGR